jgi:hypothetical protein
MFTIYIFLRNIILIYELKWHYLDNFVTLNGTANATFDLENAPYLIMFIGTGVLKKNSDSSIL